MKRNEIDDKYKWHLEDIIDGDDNWETSLVLNSLPARDKCSKNCSAMRE